MLLGEHNFVVALSLCAVILQAVKALLEGVVDFGFFSFTPLLEGFVEVNVASSGHEGLKEEVASSSVGEDIGLVVDIKDLEEEVGGSAGDADKEETGGFVPRGNCSINCHGIEYIDTVVEMQIKLGQ